MRLRDAPLLMGLAVAACAPGQPQGDPGASTQQFLSEALAAHGVSDREPVAPQPLRVAMTAPAFAAPQGQAAAATAAPTPLVPQAGKAAPPVSAAPVPPKPLATVPVSPLPVPASAAPPVPAVPVKPLPAAPIAPTVQIQPVPPLPTTPSALAPAPVRPVPPPPAPPVAIFHTRPGTTLEGTLRDWAKGHGWTVVVRTRRVWDIAAAADFSGDFQEAASGLVRALAGVVPAPVATFHANRVLVLTSQDVSDD